MPNPLRPKGIRSRLDSMPRIRHTAGNRRPAWCTRSTCRGYGRSSARWGGVPGSGWTPGSSTGRRCRSTTTRCSPRSSPTPRQAALVLADALARARLHGVRTNRELLVNVLRHPAFLDGATDTAFFDTHGLAKLSAPLADGAAVRLSAVAAALADAAHNRAAATVFGSIPSGWRNVASGYQVKAYRSDDDAEHRIEYRFSRTGLALPHYAAVHLVSSTLDQVVLADDGVDHSFAVSRYGDDVYVDSARGPVHLIALPRFPEPGSAVAQGSLVAPMPGNVIRLGAQVGDTVAAGQPLIWLEAMKMEHTITAPSDGVLAELNVNAGQQVEVGAVLARVDAAEEEGDPQ